jgi:hypothetical protein
MPINTAYSQPVTGTYCFTNVKPQTTYTVEISIPTNNAPEIQKMMPTVYDPTSSDPTANKGLADIYGSKSETAPITVTNVDVNNVNFGFYNLWIGNYVWYDDNITRCRGKRYPWSKSYFSRSKWIN